MAAPAAGRRALVATLDVWLVANQPPCDGGKTTPVPRKPDWTVEYYRVGQSGYFRYAGPDKSTSFDGAYWPLDWTLRPLPPSPSQRTSLQWRSPRRLHLTFRPLPQSP